MRGIRLVVPMLIAALLPAAAPLTASGAEPIVAAGTVYSGVYPNEWLFSAELDNFSSWAGARPTFAGNFHNVDESDTFPLNTYTKLEEAWEAQTTPWANLEIPATSAAIAAGSYDADLATWGQAIEGWLDDGGGRSLIIAPLAEMNGDWTVWGADPANFKLAFNRIQDVVEAQITDDSKVRWAFAPNGWSTPGYGGIAAYYPGDDRVDVIGLSTYNFGETLSYDGWEPVSVAVAPFVDEVVTTVSDSKPLFLAQVASSSDGGDKSGWIRDLFAYAADHENLIGVLWFNKDKETDWAVWSNGSGGRTGGPGWQDAVATAAHAHTWPLTDWFQPGPLPFSGPLPDPGPCPDGFECDKIALVTTGSRVDNFADLSSTPTVNSFWYGTPEDIPLMGDWDGDGVATPGAFRPSSGYAYIRNENTTGPADQFFFYGMNGDIPLVGDWDGDGKDTLAIYRRGQVFIKNTLGTGNAEYSFWYGVPGDRPFAGDFDGDGIDTVGLYRVTSGLVYFRNSLSSGIADFTFFYGAPSDSIMAGDWDGDGDDTVAVYRPSDGRVYFRMSNTQGPADYSLTVGGGFVHALRN